VNRAEGARLAQISRSRSFSHPDGCPDLLFRDAFTGLDNPSSGFAVLVSPSGFDLETY
jgi:hypothetical protein